jgi:hypothetical protein
MTTRVIQFSTGIGSWATARRIVDQYGTENLVLLFADTRDEDPDNYRFAIDAAAKIGVPLITVADGRDVKQVMRDERFLGNSRIAPCSKHLKQIPCRNWLKANVDPADTVLYVGIDASEIHRTAAISAGWAPWPVEFPMTEPPYVDKLMTARAEGLEPPSMYRDGYPHANCSGCCVRQGQAGWALTLRVHPDRYAEMEAFENEMRAELGDVSMMKSRIGKETVPFTLTELRKRIEAKPEKDASNGKPWLLDPYDFGGCGCLTEGLAA